MTIDENYIERLGNAVAKTLVEAFETLTIEDVNMYRLGYTKAIDDFAKSEDYLMDKIREETADVNIDFEWRKVVCLDDIRRMLHQGLCDVAEQLKEGGVE